MNKKLQTLLEQTIRTTTPLAEIGALYNTKFLNVLLGIYRVSHSTLRDIYYLSLNEETGASALALTRKIIEYGIAVEYMIWKGKEKMADQFQKHMYTETHHEIEFLKSIGQDLSRRSNNLKIGVKKVKCEYDNLSSESKKRKSWAGLSTDKMIEDLHNAKQLKYFDSSRIGQAYIWGCRLNHVSPFVVHNYMGTEESQGTSDYYIHQAMMFSILFHLRLTTRYIDELRILSDSNLYQELADKITLIYTKLENFDLES